MTYATVDGLCDGWFAINKPNYALAARVDGIDY